MENEKKLKAKSNLGTITVGATPKIQALGHLAGSKNV